MKHYICTGGCDGEASNPDMCHAEDCKKEGEPLILCGCTDGRHTNILGKDESAVDDDTE